MRKKVAEPKPLVNFLLDHVTSRLVRNLAYGVQIFGAPATSDGLVVKDTDSHAEGPRFESLRGKCF